MSGECAVFFLFIFIFIFHTAFLIYFLFVILFSCYFILFLTAINFLMFVLVRKRLLLVFDSCFDV
jgi:hypothetical protein